MSVLIHIGYPKAGSTFLQEWFRGHPNIFYDTHFLQPYSNTGVIPDKTIPALNGRQHFVISEEQLVLWQGELDIVGLKFKPFDIKAQQQNTAEALKKNFPDAKVLIVTRGFESLLQSMYAQYISMGGILGFAAYQEQMGEHLATFYDYNRVINLYRNTFGPERVIVLPFELLKEDAARFMQLLSDLSGIESSNNLNYVVVNPSLDKNLLPSYRLISQTLCNLTSIIPRNTQVKIYSNYVAALSQKRSGLAGLLSKFMGGEELTVKPETLKLFRGKAEELRQENLFAPYLKEYLL
jgi:hypothetical protein